MLHHVREEVSVKIEYVFASPFAIVAHSSIAPHSLGRVVIEA
jgi:hypothetical protein